MKLDTVLKYVVPGQPDECWEWTGWRNTRQRGRPQIGGKNASRWLYILQVGDPPEGFHVEHTCENPHCVNIAHLNAVPPEVNYARLRRTRCKYGHELTTANRVSGGFTPAGTERWKCRTCEQARDRARYRRRVQLAQQGG